ncbi:Fur-regulated basic protein FbpA [Sporolactobacillus shoreicorticis]|uniref:Fur-regulated basic protein FbpA n=1 Tax=Sporolactobacillus shoreicorticis TaxID=1923877 RepID=A0ABW5RXV0_9BACL|nr:Fur-regulated basic protein FbpA [Sporolactobacillus shoreicorticis]MCO7124901.1 Fur-regulated basic protein FbpA [Sporolactobacillus shoreicorticis]
MNHINLLRRAVENRKRYLIRELRRNFVAKESDHLNEWTLSELENEWKNYRKRCEEEIG